MFPTPPNLSQINHLQSKFNNKLQDPLIASKLQVKERINNLIFSIAFQMLKI